MRRLAALLGVALALPVLTLLAAPAASAHAVLVSSDPTDGARLPAAPAQVTLTFDEPIRLALNRTQVISETGTRVDKGATLSADGTTIVLPLTANLPEGSYTASWDVISADTHEVVGSVSFGVGRDARAGPSRNTDSTADTAAGLVRGAQFVGLALGVGVALICATLWSWTLRVPMTRTLCAVGLTLLVGGSLAELMIARIQLGPTVTRHELVTMVRFAMSALLAAILPRLFEAPRKPRAALVAAIGVVLSATIAVDGHAGVRDDAMLATLVTTAHVGAMAVWLGGLTALCVIVLPSRHTDNLRRWSALAFTCVGVLVTTGCYQPVRQVAPLQALWLTPYGRILCLKVAVVCAMLVLALLARRRLDPGRLRRTVPLEAAIGLVVLAITTVLITSPPARTSYGPAVTLDAPLDGGRHVVVRIASTRRGPTTIRTTVVDAAGRATSALAVTGNLSSRDAQIPSLPVDFMVNGNDWVSTYASAPRPGTWTLRLTVRFGHTDAVVTAAQYRVW